MIHTLKDLKLRQNVNIYNKKFDICVFIYFIFIFKCEKLLFAFAFKDGKKFNTFLLCCGRGILSIHEIIIDKHKTSVYV